MTKSKSRGRAGITSKKEGPLARDAVRVEQSRQLARVRADLRRAINDVLKANNVGLKLHSITLDTKTAGSFRCCWINGKWVCGPQCG